MKNPQLIVAVVAVVVVVAVVGRHCRQSEERVPGLRTDSRAIFKWVLRYLTPSESSIAGLENLKNTFSLCNEYVTLKHLQ